jgi:hypothetical protein
MPDVEIVDQVQEGLPGPPKHQVFVEPNNLVLTQKDTNGRLWVPGGTARNWSTAAQSPTANTDTYITGSDLLIPSYGIQIGTRLRWEISVSKTGAGSAATTWTFRQGSARTTSDTSRLAATGVSQTAAADVGIFTLLGVFRVAGAAAILQMTVLCTHNLGSATGLGGTSEHTAASFDSSAIGGTYFGVSLNTGASGAWTITQVQGTLEP